MQAIPFLVLALVAIPVVATANPIPAEVYRVFASHAEYGQGTGVLWGHPTQGARLWLETTLYYGEWGFTIGGEQDFRDAPLGTLVVDEWRRGSTDRFVATHFAADADPTVDEVATGGGVLNGWTIVVYAHT